LRESFRSVGMGLMETFLCWWGTSERLCPLARVEGADYLEDAHKAGRGVILLSAHFTTMELGLRLLNVRMPHLAMTAMYRPNANPVLDEVVRRGREAHTHGSVIAKDDIRGMLRTLRRG